MLKSKKEIDTHVRNSLSRLKSENERLLRGYTIAKLYYKINEYASAEQFLLGYLKVKEDVAQAHKMLGQCYQNLKKKDKALAAFQRSLQLDSKQKDVLVEVCKILLEDNSINPNKIKYWCDLAESENVVDESVFSLRLKLENKDGIDNNHVKDLIIQEIASKPRDIKLRIRLVRHYLDQNQVLDAFKYIQNLELNNQYDFCNCIDWYNVVWHVLNKYEHVSNGHKDWDFWLLLITILDRQVFSSFLSTSNLPNGGTTETSNLLFNFDQYLYKASHAITSVCPEKELGKHFLNHYTGQLCLHAASLIFKRELMQNKNRWKETTKTAAPLLLLAFQCGISDSHEPWMKHCSERTKQLVQLWNREGAFRCAQAGRTLLAFIDENNQNKVSNQVKNLISNSSLWSSSEELIARLRQYCSDNSWRTNIFSILFYNSDQKIKDQTSFLVKSSKLNDITFNIPSCADIETYEEIAQYFNPKSLQHMVYLGLGVENLSDVRCNFFSGLNFSTQNLNFCGAESLNQLDIDTYLYGSIIHAKRLLQVEKNIYENHNLNNAGKPLILPFVNIQSNLCSDEVTEWWTAAYQVYKNLVTDNLSEVRATLQQGIEAARGVNGPKMDLIIVFLIAKVFVARLEEALKPNEKSMLQARAVNLYKFGIKMLKLHNRGVLEPYRKIFKYANSNNSQVERELNCLAEDAVSYLAGLYFKKFEYEECIEEFNGLQLPFATFFQSEAYRKLDESNKTPKKTKRLYLDKARDCLNQTLSLLGSSNLDSNHPLKAIIHSEIKRLQFSNNLSNESSFNNTSNYEDAELGSFLNTTPVYYHHPTNRSVRDTSIAQTPSHLEIEELSKKLESTLVFLKDITDMFKPEIGEIKKDLILLKEKVLSIEENIKKKPNASAASDPPTNILDDVYIIDEDLQNQIYPNQNNMFPNYQNPNVSTPLSTAGHVPQGAPFHSPLFNPNHPLNYYHPQFMLPPNMTATQQAIFNHQTQLGQRNALGLPSYEPFNIQNVNQLTPLLSQYDSRTASNIYNILNQNQYPAAVLPQVSLATQSIGLPQQMPISTPSITPTTIVPSSIPQQQFTNLSDKFSVNASAAPSVNPLGSNNSFKKLINNTPVEKGPPVNVVITNSDPLPINTGNTQSQPTLSVTIPPHHIKTGVIASDTPSFFSIPSNNFSSMNSTSKFTTESFPTAASSSSFGAPLQQNSAMNFSFKQSTLPILGNPAELSIDSKSAENADSDINKSEAEYDPCPDFQPIIPLPDEVEVITGEEGEEVLFCSRAKLFRHIDKQWKERGIGEIKILRNNDTNKVRIIMRREQTHKICANHQITSETTLNQLNNEPRGFIWAANDFADGSIKQEKFLVRFKLPDTAKLFFNTFTKATSELKQLESVVDSESSNKEQRSTPAVKPTFFSTNKTSTPAGKGEDECQTISSRPETSKSLFNVNSFDFSKNTTPPTKSAQAKPTVFANFCFDTKNETQKPLSDIFSSLNKGSNIAKPLEFKFNSPNPSTEVIKDENKNNPISDNEDDYVPTAQFKPLIDLPDLVELSTGEENEIVLFEHRAKLLRHDKETNEWKERGLGIIKLLQNKLDANEVRLVMRREIIHKLCCNQRLYKDTVFVNAKNTKCALMWAGRDFSDNELQNETFTLRFKTPDICQSFHEAIQKAQSNMVNKPVNTNSLVEKENSETKFTGNGFGDKFKPKIGSWDCNDCYTSNTEKSLYCVACESPKDNTVPKKESKGVLDLGKSTTKFSFGIPPSVNTSTTTTSFSKSSEAVPSSMKVVGTKPSTNEESAKGFGDLFKPKAGSWSCNDCYTSNTEKTLYCVACDAPKDSTVPKKEPKGLLDLGKSTTKFSFGIPPSFNTSTTTTNVSKSSEAVPSSIKAVAAKPSTNEESAKGFGDLFKPKAGSWSCNDCYTSNTEKTLYCVACNAPKDSSVPKKEPKGVLDLGKSTTKFSFGITPSFNTNTPTTNVSNSNEILEGFGNLFKPKSGSWSCNGCNISNSSDALYCIACNTPKISKVSKEQKGKSNDTNTTSDQENKSVTSKVQSKNLAESNLPSTVYTFGAQNTSTAPSKTSVAFNFGASKDENSSNNIAKPLVSGFSFSSKSIGDTKILGDKINLPSFNLSTDIKEGGNPFAEKKEFNFTLKPKSPKSSIAGDEESEDNNLVEEEENNTYFTPVIPLPDKIDVKTGEEDEEVLYCHRAKLFRHVDGEWKERGLGDVKILRHKISKKLRVLMRREQILKICLNHILCADITYSRKDDRSWVFAVKSINTNDEIELQTLALRFKSNEISEQFMDAIKKALVEDNIADEGKQDDAQKGEKVKISDEDKFLADRLKLPYSFFEKSENICSGCRGCNPDEYIFPQCEHLNEDIVDDNPIPLTYPKYSIFNTNNSLIKESTLSTKETIEANTIDKPFSGNLFSGRGDSGTFSFNKMLNTPNDDAAHPFGSGLSTNIFGGTPDKAKSLFGGSSIFGGSLSTSDNKSLNLTPSNPLTQSIFSTSNNTSAFDLSKPLFSVDNVEKSASASIFAAPKLCENNSAKTPIVEENKETSLFAKTTINESDKSKNIFGGTSQLSKPDGPVFGSSGSFSFGSNAIPRTGSMFGMTPESKEKFGEAPFSKLVSPKTGDSKSLEIGENMFKVTGGIDFATLATQGESTSTFKTVENTSGFVGLTNNDAFKSFMKPKTGDSEKTGDTSTNGQNENDNDDSNYDPHYEPIIALPDQITVSTGEEEEEKLFSERARLFRFDAVNKEWKERGVGEFKVLFHPARGTYRLLLRREQIFKLVLNFAITPDFAMNPFNSSPKSFCWAGMNHAEEPANELLAVRFKNGTIAKQFEDVINSLSIIKNRTTDIDPKDD